MVVLDLPLMHRSVQLDRQSRGFAVEIENEVPNWVLSAELHSQCIAPETLPQQALGLGRGLPLFACERDLVACCCLMDAMKRLTPSPLTRGVPLP